jgi:hypothetical protein
MFGNDPNFFGNIHSLGAVRFVQATNNLFRKSENGFVTQKLITLENLVSSLASFKTSDPRDTVYTLLSLTNDSTPV